MSTQSTNWAEELGALNRELAALLHRPPAAVVLGAEVAERDELVACGVLGGKDVGKTTLINALAQTEVSSDEQEAGRGTDEPIAYVHEEMRDAFAHRLEDLRLPARLRIHPHRADAIRNLVLVDLPDFDSEFEPHLQVVQALAPLLERVLWVLTPRKIGDRAWVEMFNRVIQDRQNVHCVLNKADELLKEAVPFAGPPEQAAQAFWREQHAWMAQAIEAAGWPESEDHRFLLAARFPQAEQFVARVGQLWDDPNWSRYGADKPAVTQVAQCAAAELQRLRDCVLGPVSAEQAGRIKEANRKRSRAVNLTRLREHYELKRTLDELREACAPAYQARVLEEAAGPGYCLAVAEALQRRLKPDSVLADELLERRVCAWPLLRLVHWPLGWLSRMVGRRFAVAPAAPGIEEADSTTVEGRTLAGRIELARARLLADQADVAAQLKIEPDLPRADRLATATAAEMRRLGRDLDQHLIEAIRERDRKPSLIARLGLWFLLLWFPLLQPLAEGLLTIVAPDGTVDLMLGLAKLVSTLGASKLLLGLITPVGIYVAILAGMYVRAQRDVHRFRQVQNEESPLPDAVDQVLVEQIIVPLSTPFAQRLTRLRTLEQKLRQLAQ